MAITNYLVHFTTEATYNNKKSELRNDAVAFVKDATIIHTHGTDYYCGSGPVALKSDLSGYATTSALTSGLAGKANTSHTHTISQVSGLQAKLDSKLESVSLADLGITATAAELNKLDGCTATVTELNYVDGVTSNIQTQLNGKAALSHTHTASQVSGLANVATSGSYNDLTNKPSIPSLSGYATQSWVQSQGYLTSVSWGDVSSKPSWIGSSKPSYSYSEITGTVPYSDLPVGTAASTVAAGNHTHSQYLTSASLSGYAKTSDLSKYLRLSGGTLTGSLKFGISSDGTISYISQDDNGYINIYSSSSIITFEGPEIFVNDRYVSFEGHTHSAADITSGTLAIARIPTGSTASTVALGNHTHGTNSITTLTGYTEGSSTTTLSSSMSLNAALASLQNQIQTKQAAGSYAAASHTHSAANITSGTLDIARLPSITDAKITSVSASKITGTIPQANLPSYVDDVLEYSSKSSFPQTGETGKIYVDTATNLTYRWGGSSYVEISPSIAIGETSSTAYRGDRGKIAYDHSQATGNPHNLTLANLGINATATELNYMDGVTSSVQTQLNRKAATSHNHNASNINAGVLNIARIPTGTSATTVALGNHTHGSNDVTALTGYFEGEATATLSSGMSLNAALASLQNQIQTKAASSHTHSPATTSAAGFMSAADKSKLNGIANNADSVSVSRNLTSGTQIASITINGTATALYAPTNTDTKNTTGTSNSTSKLYLAGGTSQSSTGVTTYSNAHVFTQSGQLYASQMNATNGFYETSDARLKNFKDDIKALDVVSEIPTKYFTWKNDENQESQIGTSAQEVEKLYPELVSKTEDDTLTVDYAKLSIIALAAIKELKVEIQSLKEEIKQLKSK